MLSEASEAAHNGHPEDPEYIVNYIMHHVQDAHELDFFGWKLELPHIELFGFDLSITKHVVMMWLAGLIITLLFSKLAKKRSLSPKGSYSNFFEVFVVFVRDEMVYKIMGEETGRRFLPFFLTQFFFILTCNLLGLVPFCSTATGNIAVTGALALITLFMTQVGGMVEQGFFTYLKNIVPPGIPLWLLPIMVPVEILGQFTKPFALTVRLFANMTAGHLVILSLFALIFIFKSFSDLVSYAVAPGVVGFVIFINLLEIFVALIQAYIFTFLSIIFIGAAIHPEH
ncbi:MAG: F0F1 ATP synthase subunit A [Candidatus Glassbacteria bacterium]